METALALQVDEGENDKIWRGFTYTYLSSSVKRGEQLAVLSIWVNIQGGCVRSHETYDRFASSTLGPVAFVTWLVVAG